MRRREKESAMKNFVYALFVLMLSTACGKAPNTATGTETTRTGTTDSTATAFTKGQPEAASIKAHVDFIGLVCHIWNKQEAGVERAIVLRTPPSGPMHHKMVIGLPLQSKADVLKLKLPIDPDDKCPDGSTCSVLIDGLAFRFADRDGNPLGTPFSPNANFTNFVTHLRAVPHPDHPFDKKGDLIDAVFDAAPKANDPVVAGWFELAGGQGDAEPYLCKGKFEGEASEQDFVKVAKLTFTIPIGGKLQVFIANDTQWRDIAIPTSDFAITVDNDAAISTQTSHFGMYARLHKKKNPNEPDIHLPAVVVANIQTCAPKTNTIGVDAVPGCSDSGWP
jgi:hypothetical protein